MTNVASLTQSLPIGGVNDERKQLRDLSLVVGFCRWLAAPLTAVVGICHHSLAPTHPTSIRM